MTVGTYLPQRGMDRAPVEVARECEDLGYASVAVLDHVVPLGAPMGTPIAEAFATLAAAAAVTGQIGLRTLVVRAGLRPPAMTAHQARTLAALAPGRLVLGIGSGDAASRREDELIGLPDRSMAERRAEVRALVGVLREWLPAVPLWLGGAGAETQRLAGEIADGWNVWAGTPDEVRAGAALSGTPVVTWAGQVLLGTTSAAAEERAAAWRPGRAVDRERVLLGDPDAVGVRLRALAEAGVRETVVAFVGGDAATQRRDFARHVLPQL